MIWVEILSRQREVLARHRIPGDALSVGRGYGNDVVLDDPHVAPDHIRVARDDSGRLVVEDLGSLNGLYLDGNRRRLDRLVLDGDAPIRIGQTVLRIRDAAHAVAVERPLVTERRRWPLPVLLGLIILGIELIGAWRGDFREYKPATYIQPLLVVIAAVAVWSGAWTLLSRIVARAARFEAHLLIGLAAMLTISVVNEITDVGAFALSLPALAEARFALSFIILGAAAFYHMRAIGPGRMRLKLAGAAALPVLMIAYHTIVDADQRRTLDPPRFVHLLLPPAFRLAPLKTEDAFLADLGRMKAGLDRERDGKAQ